MNEDWPGGVPRREAEPAWHATARSFGLSPAMAFPMLGMSLACIVFFYFLNDIQQRGMATQAKVDVIQAEIAAYEAERAALQARLLDVQVETSRALVAAQRCREERGR
jgi:hypothetical protein